MRLVHEAVLLTVLAAAPGAFASEVLSNELLERVRAGNRAALQSIHSFHCQVAVTYTGRETAETVTGEYWRSVDMVRLKWRMKDGQTIQVYAKDGRTSTLQSEMPHALERFVGAVTGGEGGFFGQFDVWTYGFLNVSAPGEPYHAPLDQLLAKKPGALKRVEQKLEEGREYIVVTLADAENQCEYWYDPRVNYLIRKCISTGVSTGPKPIKFRSECAVHAFLEPVKGNYFPVKINCQRYYDGKPAGAQCMTLSEVRINQPLPASVLKFRFPQGTLVADHVAGKQYRIGADGKPAGPMEDLSTAMPLALTDTEFRTETLTEPVHWTGWIAPISLGVLLVAGCLWLTRRWRRRTA